jgi:hypothetical protein
MEIIAPRPDLEQVIKLYGSFLPDYDYLMRTCGANRGWESVKMVRRYAHLSSEHLSGYVDRLSALHAVWDEPDSYDLATGH